MKYARPSPRPNSPPPVTPDTKLNFGKYKGIPVVQICLDDPGYLFWLQDTFDWFQIPDILLKAAREGHAEQKARWATRYKRPRRFDDYGDLDDDETFYSNFTPDQITGRDHGDL